MDAMQAILTRRSVRKFTGEALGHSALEQILRAGMSAPSAHARNPWHFITVEDAQTRDAMRPLCKWWQMLDKAAAVVVVCADPALGEGMQSEYQVDDCAAALQNMLLAAHALGFGGVWLGLCNADPNADKVKQLLGVPAAMRVMGMAALGVPEAPARQMEKYQPERWHKNSW